MTDRTPPLDPASGSEPDAAPLGRKARTHRAILVAAGARFAEQGVAETSVEQIAAAAGVSVGTLYAHFGSKQGLVLAFISEALDVVEQLMEAARQNPSPLQRVYAAGDAYFRFAVEHPAAARFATVRVLQPDRSGEDDDLHRAMTKRTEKMVLAIATDLKEAMDLGEVPVAPIDATMVYLWGMWNGVTTLMLRSDGAAIPARLAERALEAARITIEIASEHVRDHGLPAWAGERVRANEA